MVELKTRFSMPLLDGHSTSTGSTVVTNVREALLGLGYTDAEIRDTLRELPTDVDSATLLRESLKVLGARRA